MKKILFLFIFFFSTSSFAHEIVIHLTDVAQAKIDSRIDSFWCGPINTNAFNVIATLLPLEEADASQQRLDKIYCGFSCARPHRSLQGNCNVAFRPSFDGNKLVIKYISDYLNPALFGYYPEVEIVFTSSTSGMDQVTLPEPKKVALPPKGISFAIDYTNQKGFFILEDAS